MCNRLAVQFADLSGDPYVSVTASTCNARRLFSQGKMVEALLAMKKSDEAVRRPGVARSTKARHAAEHIIFAIRQGNLEDAKAWRNRLAENVEVLPFWLRHILPRLLIGEGKKADAAEQLNLLYIKATETDALKMMIEIRVCQALAAETADKALIFLKDALIMGQPEGFIRTFVDEGNLLKPLLRKALSKEIIPEYTAKLLNIIEAEERLRQPDTETASSHSTNGILSERELEILLLIESGLSNRQIAEKLIISLGTAKTHIHNISEKLNAKTRTQALARAREIKLI